MKPLLCFKVYLGEEYEEHLMKGAKSLDETKGAFEKIVEEAFAAKGVEAKGFKVSVTGHRGGIE